jgi:hypothetical protein
LIVPTCSLKGLPVCRSVHRRARFGSVEPDPAKALLQLVEDSVHAANDPSGFVCLEASNLPVRGRQVQQESRHKPARKSRAVCAMLRKELSRG